MFWCYLCSGVSESVDRSHRGGSHRNTAGRHQPATPTLRLFGEFKIMTATANSIAWQILASITESTVSQEIPTISSNIEWQLRAAISNSPVGQLQLAVHAGISAAQLSRFTSGQQSIMLDTAARLAAALGLQLAPIAPPVSTPSMPTVASAPFAAPAVPAGNAAPEPVTAQADPDEEKTSAQGTPSPKPKPPRRQPLTEKRVLTTIEALATTSSLKPAVSLADLRQALGADRAALDALLMSLLSQQKLTLTPAAADQPLTEDETAASLLVDGQPHLLCALTTPPTTAAKSAARRGRRQTESAD